MDEKLAPRLQRKLEQSVVHSSIHQNMELLMNLTAGCFVECVHKFPSKLLDKDEASCIDHCGQRYIALSQRVGTRYQIHQATKVAEAKVTAAAAAGSLEGGGK